MEEPQETYSSDEDDFFNTYEDEEIEKVESYHTDRTSSKEEKLYTNPWAGVYSPAIYLTSIEEVPTQDEEEEAELTPTGKIKKLVEEETLDNQQRNDAILSLKEFEDLFTTNLTEIEIFRARVESYYYADEEWQEEPNLLSMMLNEEAEPIEYENNEKENSNDMKEDEEVIISYAEEERQHENLLQQLTQESGQELPRSNQG
ncbi:12787_t:CDS:2, partial [Cetraspora pellucida]